jgi:long-chain fatty acid transport protein
MSHWPKNIGNSSMKPMFKGSLLTIALLGASQSMAGGLWITEYGQPTQGRAGAGETTGNGDATDAFLNPSALPKLEKPELLISAAVIAPKIEFDVERSGIVNGDGDGGNAADPAPGGSVFYAHPLSDRLAFGISGLALTGSVLDYDDDWAGRFQVQDVSILVIGAIPSIGYRVTDKFYVGAAVPVMYSELDMDVAVPDALTPVEREGKINLDGNDVQVAGSLSFLYEFTERTRLGGRATSKFAFEYDGNVSTELLGEVGVQTDLTMAAIARVGLSHDLNDTWSLHATWGWDNWSELEDVFIATNTRGASLPRKWDDTYHYALGADYRLNRQWTLRAGVAYDTNPVDEKDRTADMPIDEQYRYAVGFDYLRDSGMRISGSLVYADYGDAEIISDRAPPFFGIEGDYKTNEIWFASVSFNWQLGGDD